MMQLPAIPLNQIPPTRKVSSATELHQYFAAQGEFWSQRARIWVHETAQRAIDGIEVAGNPPWRRISVDGELPPKGRSWRGGHPGTIQQARSAVQALYNADELGHIANALRPILTRVIAGYFPDSQMKRLQRDWNWWIVRRGSEGGREQAELIGGSVNIPVGIEDTLYLVPESPKPAEYAWFANTGAKRISKARPTRHRKKTKVENRRDRRAGFMGDAARRMRARRLPGVRIWALFIRPGRMVQFQRRTPNRRNLVPVICLYFQKLMDQSFS